jgi:hypothetical protein
MSAAISSSEQTHDDLMGLEQCAPRIRHAWNHVNLHPYCESGVNPPHFTQFLADLPVAVRIELEETLNFLDKDPQNHGDTRGWPPTTESDAFSDLDNDPENTLWEDSNTCAYVKVALDPISRRRTGFSTNAAMATLLGMSHSELIAKLQGGQLMQPMPALDVLIMMADDLLSASSKTLRYMRLCTSSGLVLVCCMTTRYFDSLGRLYQVRLVSSSLTFPLESLCTKFCYVNQSEDRIQTSMHKGMNISRKLDNNFDCISFPNIYALPLPLFASLHEVMSSAK